MTNQPQIAIETKQSRNAIVRAIASQVGEVDAFGLGNWRVQIIENYWQTRIRFSELDSERTRKISSHKVGPTDVAETIVEYWTACLGGEYGRPDPNERVTVRCSSDAADELAVELEGERDENIAESYDVDVKVRSNGGWVSFRRFDSKYVARLVDNALSRAGFQLERAEQYGPDEEEARAQKLADNLQTLHDRVQNV